MGLFCSVDHSDEYQSRDADLDISPKETKDPTWDEELYFKPKLKGNHYEYGYDRPMNANDLRGFLKHRKEMGNENKLMVLTGVHGGKNDYIKYKDKHPYVPKLSRIEKQFYNQDKRTVKELGMEKHVILCDMANPKHRAKVRKERNKDDGASIFAAHCHGTDKPAYRAIPGGKGKRYRANYR